MKNLVLQAKAQLEIAKPLRRVFEAIVDPKEMSRYFISSGTSRMQTGQNVQ